MATGQLSFQFLSGNSGMVNAAVELLAKQGGQVERGAVFTRPEVFEFILDLAGYT